MEITVYFPKQPWGYLETRCDSDEVPKGFVTAVPDPLLIQPIYDETNQIWVEGTISKLDFCDLQKQLANLAYRAMTGQQTITDLQKQNAQMAYQLMTAQGGATA